MKLQISNCKKAAVQDGMIGLFFEDINYAADGGRVYGTDADFKQRGGRRSVRRDD